MVLSAQGYSIAVARTNDNQVHDSMHEIDVCPTMSCGMSPLPLSMETFTVAYLSTLISLLCIHRLLALVLAVSLMLMRKEEQACSVR